MASDAPDANRVKQTYVRIYKPMPPQAPAHPAACDWISYLRYRNAGGPDESSRADAVFTSMPGILAGASMHDQVARSFVRRAASTGEDVEYWAIDRRANCLEDHRGTSAAVRARDPEVAFDYYWHGREVRGQEFDGFETAAETQFLRKVGLARTLRDWYAVIRDGLPNPSVRARKLVCGGHSLGGPITATFAAWDFDGDPETRSDAGYRQCAGFVGFDTDLEASDGAESVGAARALAQASAGSPYINAPPFTPPSIQTTGPLGAAAYQMPRRESVIPTLVEQTGSPEVELSTRLLLARNAAEFATGEPSPSDFRVTNEAAFGSVFDDNASPVSIVRTSLGTYRGGPVVEKDFPTPAEASFFPLPLVNNSLLMAPQTPHGPLYGWRRYDEMGGAPPQRNSDGKRFTSGRSEATDAHQLARQFFEGPTDFSEQYFPTRLATDVFSAADGDRSGHLEDMRYANGTHRRPALLIQAGDSDENSGAHPSENPNPPPPNDKELSRTLVVPGYNHIDVVSAAARQNGGRPEASSRTLTSFVLKVVGAAPAG